MKRLRVAIVGGGFGTQVHAPAWMGLPDVDVVAVSDGGSGRAARSEFPFVKDWRTAVADSDLVVVAVPPAAQLEITLECLVSGRHVLCEKPCGLDVGQAATLATAAATAGRLAVVGFQYRYHPGILALRRLLSNHGLGMIRGFAAEWMTGSSLAANRPWNWQHDATAGGGVGRSHAGHLLDLMSWLGTPADRVIAAERRVLISDRVRDGMRLAVTAEDEITALLAHGDSARSTLRVCNCQPGGGGLRLTVFGEAGTAWFSWRYPFRARDLDVAHRLGDDDPTDLLPQISATTPAGDERIDGVRRLAQRMIESINGIFTDPLPSFADALQVHRMLEQMRTGVGIPTTNLR